MSQYIIIKMGFAKATRKTTCLWTPAWRLSALHMVLCNKMWGERELVNKFSPCKDDLEQLRLQVEA